jgi:hypothetical protein
VRASRGIEEHARHRTLVAALVWGRDEDGGGLAFKQQDVEKLLQRLDHRGAFATAMMAGGLFPMRQDHAQPILSLCVSDVSCPADNQCCVDHIRVLTRAMLDAIGKQTAASEL